MKAGLRKTTKDNIRNPMAILFDNAGTVTCKSGEVGDDNYVKLRYYNQYYAELECIECGSDIKEGYYWLNVGRCHPICVRCVEGEFVTP